MPPSMAALVPSWVSDNFRVSENLPRQPHTKLCVNGSKSKGKAFRQTPGDNTGLIQFSIFTNDLKAKVKCTIMKFAADMSPGGQEDVARVREQRCYSESSNAEGLS